MSKVTTVVDLAFDHLFSVIKGICFSALARMRKMEKESEQELVRLHVGLPAILVTSSGKAGSGESSDHLETQTSTFDKSQTEVERSEGTKLIYSKKQRNGVGVNCSKFDCSTIICSTFLAGNQLLDTKFINCSRVSSSRHSIFCDSKM
jgi:hypothetical protein